MIMIEHSVLSIITCPFTQFVRSTNCVKGQVIINPLGMRFVGEILVDEGDGHAALTDAGGYALD